MKITSAQWNLALTLNKEFENRGEILTREKLAELLQISEGAARDIRFALENIDIIRMQPDKIILDGERVELDLFDLHIPYHDRLAIEAALSYAESKYKITDINIMGDGVDFYQISIFVKMKPQKKSVKEEMKAAKDFLSDLIKRFPGVRIKWKEGNHEYRLNKYIIQNAPEIADMIEDLMTRQMGFEELGVDYIIDPFKIGKLWHLHGHEFPSGGGVQKVCDKVWNFVPDHFTVGHFHRTDSGTKTHVDSSINYNLNSVGWLGSHSAVEEYAKVNKYNQGFAIVEYSQNGNFVFHNKRILCGEVF